MGTKTRLSIGVIAPVGIGAGQAPLSNLVSILRVVSDDLTLITLSGFQVGKEKNARTYQMTHTQSQNPFTRAIRYAWLQARFAYRVARVTMSVDTWVLFGANPMVIPVLTAKILRKPVVIVLPGSYTLASRFSDDILAILVGILERITLVLADRLILYSPRLIKEWHIEKHIHKIRVAKRHFVDLTAFNFREPLARRPHIVGYIGRLSGEKGVLPFLDATRMVVEASHVTTFLIGGDGQLRSEVEECVAKSKEKVEYAGWINRDALPHYLNRLRLLVLPSYTEGLPNIMLEAMACGTPVLAVPAGAIPDVIVDGETGFLMDSNSPECIAENILRALSHPDPNRIALNARALVETEFTLEKAVGMYRSALSKLGRGEASPRLTGRQSA